MIAGGRGREPDRRVRPVGGDGVLGLGQREMETTIAAGVTDGGIERALDGVFSLRFDFGLWPNVAQVPPARPDAEGAAAQFDRNEMVDRIRAPAGVGYGVFLEDCGTVLTPGAIVVVAHAVRIPARADLCYRWIRHARRPNGARREPWIRCDKRINRCRQRCKQKREQRRHGKLQRLSAATLQTGRMAPEASV